MSEEAEQDWGQGKGTVGKSPTNLWSEPYKLATCRQTRKFDGIVDNFEIYESKLTYSFCAGNVLDGSRSPLHTRYLFIIVMIWPMPTFGRLGLGESLCNVNFGVFDVLRIAVVLSLLERPCFGETDTDKQTCTSIFYRYFIIVMIVIVTVIIRRVRVSPECLFHKAARKRRRGHEEVLCPGQTNFLYKMLCDCWKK